MAVIHATPGRLRDEPESGMRAFDIGTDLRPVAELIADAFTNELDPRGKAALREMRIMSHVSGLLKLLTRGTGELDDVFSGFVWLEDGKLVGNVTVQRADKFGSRWQIANVAVLPEYRGRGIARMLMQRAMDHIGESGGRWAVLQVYDHNTVARSLYVNMGFEEVGGTIDLELMQPGEIEPPDKVPNFRPFSSHHWQPLYELAASQHSSHAQWWRPLRRSDFQVPVEQQAAEWFWKTVGRSRVIRRCIQTTRRFEAALILSARSWPGKHKLEMWVRPEQYGAYEDDLVRWALAELQDYPRWPVATSLSVAHTTGVEVCKSYGFRKLQTLLTMRHRIGE